MKTPNMMPMSNSGDIVTYSQCEFPLQFLTKDRALLDKNEGTGLEQLQRRKTGVDVGKYKATFPKSMVLRIFI